MTPEEAAQFCVEAAAKGTQLMTDMGTKIVASMSSPSMPSDSALIGILENTAKTMSDYTEKAASAVTEMANTLLSSVKGAIQSAISKTPPKMPAPTDITAAIKTTIESAA